MRTPARNWKLGQQDVNILLLSAVWNGFSLPLMWTLLPHGGASRSCTREALVERFLRLCSDREIRCLLADREFIGQHWFRLLDQHGIAPCIRLPARSTIVAHGMPIWAVSKKLQVGEVRVWRCQTRIYGVNLRVAATKNAAGDMLYLAYRGHALPNMRRYALRWQTENVHAALKTRGFNLEDRGLTRAERVSTLLTVVSVAFIWACMTGKVVHLQDLLLHPSGASWRTLSTLMPRFEG